MHTRLDRQAADPVSAGSPSRCPRRQEGRGAQSCLGEGPPGGASGHLHLGVLGLVPGGKPSVLLRTGPGRRHRHRHRRRWLLLGAPRLPAATPDHPPGAPGPGTSHHSQSEVWHRVLHPVHSQSLHAVGGKYKRCLCLKPNMGVTESPGLGPSFGPGLLATEGWAETRGRPPSDAPHGSCA